jgi:polyphosphate kinase
MPRNFRRRVEIMFPIESPSLRRRVVDGLLGVLLADNAKARELQPDGTYRRVRAPGANEPTIRSQVEFENMAIEACETSPIGRQATALGATAEPRIIGMEPMVKKSPVV